MNEKKIAIDRKTIARALQDYGLHGVKRGTDEEIIFNDWVETVEYAGLSTEDILLELQESAGNFMVNWLSEADEDIELKGQGDEFMRGCFRTEDTEGHTVYEIRGKFYILY